jgi:hypothetical protein
VTREEASVLAALQALEAPLLEHIAMHPDGGGWDCWCEDCWVLGRRSGPFTVTALASAAGMPRRCARRALERCERRGLVVRVFGSSFRGARLDTLHAAVDRPV